MCLLHVAHCQFKVILVAFFNHFFKIFLSPKQDTALSQKMYNTHIIMEILLVYLTHEIYFRVIKPALVFQSIILKLQTLHGDR